MIPAFERFVSGIVRQTDGNGEERDDLYEELLTHLECAFMDYKRQGFSEEEAIRTAMTNFGTEEEIGTQLQEAMYPRRKGMMLALAVVSLLYAYSVYACQLFIMGDAHIPWLVLAVLISTAILIVTVRPVSTLNRRFWMNSLLLAHLVIYFYGLLLATDLREPYSIGMTLIAVLLILLAIILVYRTTIFDYPSKRQPLKKEAKWLHFINITLGIFNVFVTLFFLWGFLWFAPAYSPVFLLLLIPIGLWIIAYSTQMILLRNEKKKWSFAVLLLYGALILAAILFWLFGILGIWRQYG